MISIPGKTCPRCGQDAPTLITTHSSERMCGRCFVEEPIQHVQWVEDELGLSTWLAILVLILMAVGAGTIIAFMLKAARFLVTHFVP